MRYALAGLLMMAALPALGQPAPDPKSTAAFWLQVQRNDAGNQVAQCFADVAGMQAKIAALEAVLAELKAKLAEP